MACKPGRGRWLLGVTTVLLFVHAWPSGLIAGGSDVFVCVLGSPSSAFGFANFGSGNGFRAFAVQTFVCNGGDTGASWVHDTNQHPVIGQNMYRLRNGRFEQIGQAWVKHGFFAETDSGCTTCITPNPDDGTILGVGCCDVYGAVLNGTQAVLGPKSEINASTGVFPYPFCQTPCPSPLNVEDRRLQVAESDLDTDPAVHYFMEGQYLIPDDCAASPRTDFNNASYRRIGIDSNLSLSGWIGSTAPGSPAILAWGAADAAVSTVTVDIPNDGRFYIAAKATDLGSGQWHYEYAVHNLNSDRSGARFTVPIAPRGRCQQCGISRGGLSQRRAVRQY